MPLFTVLVDGRPTPASALPAGLALVVTRVSGSGPGAKLSVVFRNEGKAKITLENLVPLGEGADRTYITAGLPNEEPHTLDRSQLFRPGLRPVGVVLPDNAWHMGFASVDLAGGRTLSAIARRVKTDKAERTRWASVLAPGGSVEYALYFEAHRDGWRRGLEIMFRERYLYDLEKFDEALFERADLAWVRRAYLMVLRFAWDRSYYDREAGYTFDRTLTAWDRTLGPVDIFTIWPTWPRLGLDSRNQWDMYRDLPGGLDELRRQVDLAHSLGKKYFISYNPWDESTRHEDHIAGMERMLRTLDADGVVLDTRGESSREFQEAADRVKPGIVMYSEGMAVPRDMPGIVSGRVHDALYMPPPLNLNKFMPAGLRHLPGVAAGRGAFAPRGGRGFLQRLRLGDQHHAPGPARLDRRGSPLPRPDDQAPAREFLGLPRPALGAPGRGARGRAVGQPLARRREDRLHGLQPEARGIQGPVRRGRDPRGRAPRQPLEPRGARARRRGTAGPTPPSTSRPSTPPRSGRGSKGTSTVSPSCPRF